VGVERGTGGGLSNDLPRTLDELIVGLADHLPELIVLLDEDGQILWYNVTAEGVLGWQREQWVGRNIVEILHPDDAVRAAELLVSARATGPGAKEPVLYRLATVRDWIDLEAVASVVRLESGRTVMIVSARVDGRARREEFIAREVGERLSFAYERAVVPMAKIGLDGHVLGVNPELARRYRVEPASLHGVSLVGLVRPADRPVVAATIAAASKGATVEVEAGLEGVEERCRLHLSLVPDWLDEPMYLFLQVLG
jgi:PAS domain S-box-containing protein